jgi:hypothetical protein
LEKKYTSYSTICNAFIFSYQDKKETVQYEDKTKNAKKPKTKNTAVLDEAIASEESSDIAIIQAATGCQVVAKTT